MPSVAIYTRVSSDPGSTSASTSRQERACRAYAEVRGWDVVGVYEDVDTSAYLRGVRRPSFERLQADLPGLEGVLVWRLDRLVRQPADFEQFWSQCENASVFLTSATEPVDTSSELGVAIVRILVTFAQLESHARSERLRAKNAELARSGAPPTRSAYGFSADWQTVVPHEAAFIREIARRFLDGENLTSIARAMTAAGHRTRAGKPWTAVKLRQLITADRMVGDRIHHGQIVAVGVWPAILERDAFEAIRCRIPLGGGSPLVRGLLTGWLICGRCGARLHAQGLGRAKRRVYVCAAARHLGVSAAPTEAWIRHHIIWRSQISARWDERAERLVPAPLDITAWDGLSLEERRGHIGRHLEKVVVLPSGRGMPWEESRLVPTWQEPLGEAPPFEWHGDQFKQHVSAHHDRISATEVMRLLNISNWTFYRLRAAARVVPVAKVGTRWVFSRSATERLASERAAGYRKASAETGRLDAPSSEPKSVECVEVPSAAIPERPSNVTRSFPSESQSKRIAIYTRVSMAREGARESVLRQERICRSFAVARGWEVANVYEDVDVSAYRPRARRPSFEQLQGDLGDIDGIVFSRLDRLARQPGAFERFWRHCEERGVFLASASEPIDTSSEMGVAFVRVLVTFAQLESQARSARLRSKYEELARAGAPPTAWPAFGHGDGWRSLVPDEAELIRETARRFLAGEDLESIAQALNASGRRTRKGVPWRGWTLRQLLESPRMVGDRSYRGEVVAVGAWPAILNRDDFNEIQHRLGPATQRRSATRGLLTGWLICGKCGGRLRHSTDSASGKRRYRCGTVEIAADGSRQRTCALAIAANPTDAWIEHHVVWRSRLLAHWDPDLRRLVPTPLTQKAWESMNLIQRRSHIQRYVVRIIVRPATTGERWTSDRLQPSWLEEVTDAPPFEWVERSLDRRLLGEPDRISASEAARILGVSSSHLSTLTKNGTLTPAERVGSRWIYDLATTNALAERRSGRKSRNPASPDRS